MVNRRRFLQLIMSGLGLTALGSFVYPLLRYFSPSAVQIKEKQQVINRRELPAGDARDISVGGVPAIIINRPGKGFIVLSKVCTHLGCLVQYEKARGRLLCPCHGGQFDLDGNVISGPPPKPLPKFPFRVEGDTITIG